MNIKEERGDTDPASQSTIRVFVCEAPMEEGSWSRSKSVNEDVGCERAQGVEGSLCTPNVCSRGNRVGMGWEGGKE